MKPLSRLVLCLLLSWSLSPPAAAQSADPAREDVRSSQAAFAPLDLFTPNAVRLGSGEPGPEYWQQRADYDIQVRLLPESHRIEGTETITYTNNAPVALNRLWLQLDQNLFKPDSRGAAMQPPDSRWGGAFSGGGFHITRVELVREGRRSAARYLIDDTRMRVDLDAPLPPGGGQIDIEIDFSFTIPPYGADRMGRLDVEQGTVYEIAQWYPRLYVFDDLNGWNVMPYLGQGEFYLEYGTFDVAITVPRRFVVVATGTLQNPEEVLTAEQQLRLEHARQSAETVMIIERSEVGTPGSRPDGSAPLTWRFRAENVRDFAWAASDAFIWDAASWQDVLVMSVYPSEGITSDPDRTGSGWEMSTQFVRHSIQHYSEQWYPYPYPVAINVAGIVGGMEYPMMAFCSVQARGQALFGVTDHEFGHMWFPMIVGNDERRHAWMDEGLDTFMNHYSNLAYYGDAAERAERTSATYVAEQMRSAGAVLPTYTLADQIPRPALGFLAYRKPGAGLVILREYVLGPERFDPAFRAYIERWAFKHPQPADFFRTMEDVAGEALDWFWRGWFMGTGTLDQAVEQVTSRDGQTIVTLANREDLVMPVEMLITYTDGRTERRRIPVEAWATGSTFETALPGADVASVTLDPDGILPDLDRSNNTWQQDGYPASPAQPEGR